MFDELKGLLLNDCWAPVTSEMGFLENSAEQAAQAFASWQRGLMTPRGISVGLHSLSGSLEQMLVRIPPLNNAERRRHLFIPTRSAWTAYVDNGWNGTDASSAMGYMAEALGCRGLRVVAVPHTLRKKSGRYGAVILEVYGPRQATGRNDLRTLYAANDGGRWVFGQSGEPFPFEKAEQYKASRVRDRFTFDLLKEYLLHLGLSPFEEDFYLPQGAAAWLVEKTGPVAPTQREYTLTQVREHF